VFQLNVSVKRFIEHFSGFLVGILWIGYCLFDADDLMALRALANTMTGAIHLVSWSEPTRVDQFWLFHAALSFRPDSFCQPLLISNYTTTDSWESLLELRRSDEIPRCA
jgi:hypothetical protein